MTSTRGRKGREGSVVKAEFIVSGASPKVVAHTNSVTREIINLITSSHRPKLSGKCRPFHPHGTPLTRRKLIARTQKTGEEQFHLQPTHLADDFLMLRAIKFRLMCSSQFSIAAINFQFVANGRG
jgi:hypothetical protein